MPSRIEAACVVLAGERAEGQRRIRQQRHAQAVHGLVQAVVQEAAG
jgi:hypothetical protein